MRPAHAKDGVVLQCHMCLSGAGKDPSPRLRPAHTTAVPPQYSRGKWRSQGPNSLPFHLTFAGCSHACLARQALRYSNTSARDTTSAYF